MVNARRATLRRSEATGEPGSRRSSRRQILLRWLPLGLAALALVLLYAAGLQDYLSLDTLRRYQGTLLATVAARPASPPPPIWSSMSPWSPSRFPAPGR